MTRKTLIAPLTILVNACVWGFALIMTAHTLSGTGAYQQIQHILGGCAGISVVIVGGGVLGLARKADSGA